MAATAIRCERCGGRGGWEGWPGFTCYRCGGSGIDHRSMERKVERAEARAARKAERERASADMAQDIYIRECAGCGVWTALGPTHPCRLCGTPYVKQEG